MCEAMSSTALLALMAGTTAMQIDQNEKARSAQNQAQDQARADADTAYNKANQKKPDIASMLAQNLLAGKAGNGGTMLTGPQGAGSPTSLGRTTLLGGG